MADFEGAPLPPADQESKRLAWLRSRDVIGSCNTDPSFDRITRMAARIFKTPIALVSLVAKDHQWFKSNHGLYEEMPAAATGCAGTAAGVAPGAAGCLPTLPKVGGKVEGKVEVEAAGGGEGVGEETRKTRKEETRKKEQRKKEKRVGRRNTGAVRGSLAGSEGDTLVLEDIACGFGYLVVYVRPS